MECKYNFEKEYREQILQCSRCGFCQEVCPVFRTTLHFAYSTRGKMLLLKEVIEGSIEPSQELADVFYSCTTCQACNYSCPSGIKGDEVVEWFRSKLYEDGLVPRPVIGVRESVLKAGNVFHSAKEERIEIYPPALREKAQKGELKERAETLLFMGCLPSYLDMKIVPSLINGLDVAEVDFTTLSTEEGCCGLPLFLMGSNEFESRAEKLMEKIMATGARELVTPCAGCYKTFKNLYPNAGDFGLEVYHSVQYFDKLLNEQRIKFGREYKKKVTYHDPCDIGRACKIFEEPRRILKEIPGLEYVEMAGNRIDSRCCGGGGGLQAYNPEMAVKMAVERVKDALAVGAELIVSACPACKDNLRKGALAIPKQERGKIKIIDITEIVAEVVE